GRTRPHPARRSGPFRAAAPGALAAVELRRSSVGHDTRGHHELNGTSCHRWLMSAGRNPLVEIRLSITAGCRQSDERGLLTSASRNQLVDILPPCKSVRTPTPTRLRPVRRRLATVATVLRPPRWPRPSTIARRPLPRSSG